MTHLSTIRRNARPAAIGRAIPRDEQGYILLAAIFFLALLVISLSVAAPRIAKSIQRDRELETFRRGMQYRRAIQLYYRSFNAYPPNVDALVNTNQIRFLRKKYIDPITGKDDWKPVLYGENKTPTAMGFFGQPLSGNASTIAGVGPSGGSGLSGNNDRQEPLHWRLNIASRRHLDLLLIGYRRRLNLHARNLGQRCRPNRRHGGNEWEHRYYRHDKLGNQFIGRHWLRNRHRHDTGQTGQTFGGAGIIGFSPASPKQSVLVYKKKNHYNEWEFTYDPLSDMQTMSGGNTGTVGQPAASTSSPAGSSSFGSSTFGSSTFGSSSSPASPSSTTTPQQ